MRFFVGLGVVVAITMIAYGLIANRAFEVSSEQEASDTSNLMSLSIDDFAALHPSGNSRNPTGSDGESNPRSILDISDDDFCFEGQQGVETSVADRTIVIDPGHGGEDLGTVNQEVGLTESELVLGISALLRDRLVASGATVCMTRLTDDYVGLAQRAYFANERGGDAFVSIHLNSLPERSENHTMTMWGNEAKDRYLAERVLEPLRYGMAYPESYNGKPNPMSPDVYRVKDLDSYMLKAAEMPAVLVEAAFLSNPWEAQAFLDGKENGSHWREHQVADLVHEGLLDYFEAFR